MKKYNVFGLRIFILQSLPPLKRYFVDIFCTARCATNKNKDKETQHVVLLAFIILLTFYFMLYCISCFNPTIFII